jgi:hypothetical protein
MTKPIRFRETTDLSVARGDSREVLAARYDPTRRVTLRFQLDFSDPSDFEALRYARRAMIREERLRGLEWDEPSMEDPTLTTTEIRWFALASQGAWCREKVSELIDRANRARDEMRAPEE